MNWKKIELMLLIISGFAVYFAECGLINSDRVRLSLSLLKSVIFLSFLLEFISTDIHGTATEKTIL